MTTTSGVLTGTTTGTTDTFLGVRYAQPPTGALRLAPTVPAAATSAPRDATQPGSSCRQTAGAAAPAESEDCLFLNVTRPSEQGNGPLPVIVWWHGGGFVGGSGARFVPTRMVSQGGVVVVTVNYRLGDLGYLALPGLAGGGNFGFADQLESLRWVRRNIAAFGGDATNVTVAGESAGAFSVCAALASPAASGLFDRAIMSSGSCGVDWAAGTFGRGSARMNPYRSRASAEQIGTTRAAALGCSGATRLACLRAKPASAFLQGPTVSVYPPAYGTSLLPQHPLRALQAKSINRVPVLSGSNGDEARLMIGLSERTKPYTSAEYAAALRTAFGAAYTRVAQAYPSVSHPSPALAWASAATDATWSCRTQTANRLTAALAPTFAYEFDDARAPAAISVPGFPFGAYHSADVQYLFDNTGLLDAEQLSLGDTMIAYWTNFARTGDPNGDALPAMSRFDERGSVTSLAPGADGIRSSDFATDHRCALWSTIAFAGTAP